MEGKRASLRAKSAPLVLAWLVTTFGGSLARAEALSPNEKHYFHIEETSLTIAIQKLSKQANIQIITSIDTTHKTGNKVSGVMSTQHALALLLEGQSIKAEYVAGGYILREDVKEPDPSIPRLESEDIENVVVTGYRDSLLQALARKRAAVGSQDSIVAEDIAAFPDLNLAESLQRIPGVAITRDTGEGRQISLRGLGPDFTRTQLNGMEILSNTASGMDNRGLVSRTRSFDYSVFASELFNAVDIQKSYAVNQDEGGIGGTILLRTAKPFDYDGFEAVIAAKAMTNTNTGALTPRLVGQISNRWGPWGALVSIAYSTTNSNEYGYRNWGWNQITINAANIGPAVSTSNAAALQSTSPSTQLYAPQAETYSTWYDHRERLGVTAALQYQSGDRLSFGFDVMYGRLTDHRDNYALAAAGTNGLTGNVFGTQILNSVVIQGNSIIAADYSGVDLRSEYNVMQDSTKFVQAVFNGLYQVSETLSAKILAGYSRSEYALPVFDKVFLESQNHSFSFDYHNPGAPVNAYGFDLTDPDQWNLMRMDTQENAITSDYVNGKLDLAWTPNQFSTIEFGAEYKKFMNDGWTRTDKVFHNTPTDTAIPDADKEVVPHGTIAPYIVGNVDKSYAYIGQIRDLSIAYDVPGSDFQVSEKTFGGYLQFDWNSSLFGISMRGNAGVRYFMTNLTSKGMLDTGAGLQPVAIVHHYSDFLPAANLAVDITDEAVGRISMNRNISRPSLSDLAAAGTLTTAPFGGTIDAGNPNLKPFMADSIEGSLEYYSGRTGYAALGLFYKNMKSFITSQTSVVTYGSTGYPLSFLLPGQDGSILYNYTAPINGKGAVILGLEAALQRDFDFLPAPLDHLGFVGNLTYADGETGVTYSGTVVSLPLYYLSKLSANATLYYETDLWGARISDAYRSKYLDGAGGNGNIGDGIGAGNNLDFSAHYDIDSHLKFVVEGINLTDQPISQFTDVRAQRLEALTKSGATYTFGLTYNF